MIAVAVGLGSVWALDSGSTLYRIDPGRARVTKRIQLGASAAYNIWIGAGAVWIADDQGARAPPGLPVDEQGRRADPGRRRPGRHGLPRRPGVGDHPPRQHRLPDRHVDQPRHAARDRRRLRRGRRAAGAPRRRALDHGARSSGSSSWTRRAERSAGRSTSAARASTSSLPRARCGCPSGRRRSTEPASPR